jgi:hypothetical protein
MFFKYAQITVMVILVMIILFLFGIVFYIQNLVAQEVGTRKVITSQQSSFDSQSLRMYVESCLNKVVTNALLIIGRQGGKIYTEQGGFIDKGVLYLNYSNYTHSYNVSYDIFPPTGSIGIYNSTLPTYPWDNDTRHFPYNDSDPGKEFLDGYYGINYLPNLQRPYNNSIQEQLENYTNKQIPNCVDWSAFEEQGFNITPSNVTTNVTFGESDINFDVNYPLTITETYSGRTSSLTDFHIKVPIRFKQIYNFTYLIIQKDTTNITFNITELTNGSIIPNINRNFSNTTNDFINVSDNQSILMGKPFEFWFMRHNRAPGLYHIDFDSNKAFAIGNDTAACIEKFIGGSLTAADPDEDELFFNVTPRNLTEDYVNNVCEFKTPSLSYCPINISVNDSILIDWQNITVKVNKQSNGDC